MEKRKVGRPKGSKNKEGVKTGRPKGSIKPVEEKRNKEFKFRISSKEALEIKEFKKIEAFEGLGNREIFFKLKKYYVDTKN